MVERATPNESSGRADKKIAESINLILSEN